MYDLFIGDRPLPICVTNLLDTRDFIVVFTSTSCFRQSVAMNLPVINAPLSFENLARSGLIACIALSFKIIPMSLVFLRDVLCTH
jgi:hypothetical protein